VATPNYSYEKRQRELAKKRKQEEKRQKKLHQYLDQLRARAVIQRRAKPVE
jgi:hypothetical protein